MGDWFFAEILVYFLWYPHLAKKSEGLIFSSASFYIVLPTSPYFKINSILIFQRIKNAEI
jgi:hypothetical protein